jgi:hypothetical protein
VTTSFFEGTNAWWQTGGCLFAPECTWNDVQDEASLWNQWVARDRRRQCAECTCGTRILHLDNDAWKDELRALGWYERDDRMWFCSVRCAAENVASGRRAHPRLRYRWWYLARGVNVWQGVCRHITYDNEPSGYGRC